jgi:hypothetical protein
MDRERGAGVVAHDRLGRAIPGVQAIEARAGYDREQDEENAETGTESRPDAQIEADHYVPPAV